MESPPEPQFNGGCRCRRFSYGKAGLSFRTRVCVKTPSMLRVASARTGCGVSKINHLTVRPELSRRAPVEFSHNLTNVRNRASEIHRFVKDRISPCARNGNSKPISGGVSMLESYRCTRADRKR